VTYRIFSGHLGSPRLVFDGATDAVVQVMVYDIFGNVIADTNPRFQRFGFAGGLYSRDLKLIVSARAITIRGLAAGSPKTISARLLPVEFGQNYGKFSCRVARFSGSIFFNGDF
jgi:hypothetical protein